VPRYLPNIRAPYSMDESVRASTKFPIVINDKERLSFGVGVTMINALNRTTRYIQDKTIGDSNFGQVYRGGGPRTLQLDGRFEW
jgi:hypothetical protein